jgi:DNA-binding GntR family transcriptional regulator
MMIEDRQCMSDRIRRTLATRIFNGSLKPGERLIELAIAREFDTSQTPVREALRKLESQRLVETVPYRGTRVRAVSDQEMQEAYAVRAVLEQMAAETAASALLGNVSELRSHLAKLHAAATSGDREAYVEHNMRLHRSIVVAAKNQVLLHVWESLDFETKSRQRIAGIAADVLAKLVWQHDPVVDALEAGDGQLAGRLLRDHAEWFLKSDKGH